MTKTKKTMTATLTAHVADGETPNYDELSNGGRQFALI
jgi:hypothetical protein